VKKLTFFKMSETEIFQTLEGSKNLGYSMMPGLQVSNPLGTVTSEIGEFGENRLKKSFIPDARPQYKSIKLNLIQQVETKWIDNQR